MNYPFAVAHPFLASLAVVAGIAAIVFCISYVISQAMREKRKSSRDAADAANEQQQLDTQRRIGLRQSAFAKDLPPPQPLPQPRNWKSQVSRAASTSTSSRPNDWDAPLFPGVYHGGMSHAAHSSPHVDSAPCAPLSGGWDGGSGGSDSPACSPSD